MNRFFRLVAAWHLVQRLWAHLRSPVLETALPSIAPKSSDDDEAVPAKHESFEFITSPDPIHDHSSALSEAPQATRVSLSPIHAHELSELEESAGRFDKIAFLPPIMVHIAELEHGKHLLADADLADNSDHIHWRNTAYRCFPVSVYAMKDALVHGAVGITAVDGHVIAESLWHTQPQRHRYERIDQDIVLLANDIDVLSGTYISLLVGGAENYWHALIDSAARLAAIPSDVMREARGLLLPSTGNRLREMVDLFGVPDHFEIKVVTPDQTIRVETLVLTSSLHGLFDYHPEAANKFFDRVLARTPEPNDASPTRLYIDRRGADLRRLVNETELVSALEAIGFVAVRMETLDVEQQIAIFRGAEVIVAPHGAGLTNIGYARKGTLVIELMMNFYLNWCFRRIAALRALRYDCFIGQSLSPRDVALANIQAQTWTVDIEKLVDFVVLVISRD